MNTRPDFRAACALALLAGTLVGCEPSSSAPGAGSADAAPPAAPAKVRTLTLGAYTTPREVYGKRIIPAFREHWRAKTGEEVRFEESYLGSGAQARAIKAGFEADVAALSLEPDVQTLVDAGLVRPEWKSAPYGGMVTRSVVVIGVRPGNPKGIRDWDDLRRADVEVLTPNPRTSGGAMWNVAAVYGASLRGGSADAAERAVGDVLARVKIMDKGARESMLTYESGVGDAVITYENEVLVARQAGEKIDYVTPRSTILIENPVALVDTYVDRHGNRDVAEEFVRFLTTPAVQRMYAEYGLRPVDPQVAAETEPRFARVGDLFTIRDLGGWPAATRTLFAGGGVFDRATARRASAR